MHGDHPRRDYLDTSVILTTVFDSDSCACFMPVSRIMSRCAISSPISLNFDYGVDTVCHYVLNFRQLVAIAML